MAEGLAVLENHVTKRVDPIITKRKEEHFIEMADITLALLVDGLETVTEDERIPGEPSYTSWKDNIGHNIPVQELSVETILASLRER